MRLLLDTNVVLDVLLGRRPFVDDAAELFSAIEAGEASGYLGATTVTTVFYLVSKALGAASAREHVGDLMTLFDVAPVTRLILTAALRSHVSDYEDAVLAEAAREIGVDAVVTRNQRDFRRAGIPVLSPGEALQRLRP